MGLCVIYFNYVKCGFHDNNIARKNHESGQSAALPGGALNAIGFARYQAN
jgi:hypothetical protein